MNFVMDMFVLMILLFSILVIGAFSCSAPYFRSVKQVETHENIEKKLYPRSPIKLNYDVKEYVNYETLDPYTCSYSVDKLSES